MDSVLLFKCLADETRLRSLLLIQRESELCVCELTTALNESQPKISRHLAQLRSCGLLQDRREGIWVFYQLHPDLPRWVVELIDLLAREHETYLQPNLANLKNMGERPQRRRTCCPA
ncbi:ArsR family transcriptional regulator [Pseudidiomarina salinarum]|uniref:ArsR family transcriptional regulator n=1 Tax=Pseudidiomarina salinarum TaxID=435908 RepID=A0A094ISM7_9GAMM|nr:metalloregulator ArsR/SmtB family transcription factor [Pseudidiomarina salinarum]KFZ30152.1 ArsR family transcriptional regulator [Pseudidiomarina salinarum]RUO68655.1 transcriptional regulator [Pseudidiomarina salinarum]